MRSQLEKTILVGLVLSGVSTAWSQNTTVRKSETKPPFNGVMSLNELRQCLSLQSQLTELSQSIELAKSSLERDKELINASRQSLEHMRANSARDRDEVRKADDAVRLHADAISRWNDEMKELEESTMTAAQRRKKELEKERAKLQSTNDDLLAKRDEALKVYEGNIALFNSRANELDSTIKNWNKLNEKLTEDADKVSTMRSKYAVDCSDRKFREDDESAIKLENK